ncbi:SagB/ThcOx family dehydrogenase [Uliginosibacterium sp. TH139]|uniref:SagB/ThcOx family dehydrogenase n=1 Tax=Uliginosibacterium sp. TH139 TaxID=2067453 RepID=UPI00117E4FDF|nr:SagB/ThcOx family dehydrogenase [Uliginosibacterium sp. TH139]
MTAIYSINPLLLIFPCTPQGVENRQIVGELACAAPLAAISSPVVLEALSVVKKSFTKKEFIKTTESIFGAAEAAESAFLALLEHQILVATAAASRGSWDEHQWAEAWMYHRGTRSYPFIDMGDESGAIEDRERMREYSKISPPPSNYKVMQGERIELEKISRNDSIQNKLDSMPISLKRKLPGLSMFFDVCFGERGKVSFENQGKFLQKSIPSGGARHPTEAYLVSFEDEELAPGVYHYNVQEHCLTLINKGQYFDLCSEATFDLFKKYKRKPKHLLILTSIYERAMWRYRDSRSWRAIPMDVGHALMLFRVMSEAIGYDSYTYQKFDDDALEKLLCISKISETPLFVGTMV